MINMSKVKEQMPTADPQKRIKNFEEVELGFTNDLALSEAKRCLNCKSKPCVSKCPVGVNIPGFINEIVNGNIKKSYDLILDSNIFPAICGRVCPQEKQCEAGCVRAKNGEAVSIGRLERYVADKNLNFSKIGENFNISIKTAHKIAVVGSGPSGLTCAFELAKSGFKVTVFEALHMAGGVLAYGIPEFRLPEKILESEIAKLKNCGVDIVTNVVIGKSLSVEDLFNLGYEAIYISCGAGLPKFMNIPGEGLSGIYCANEFLTRVNLMKSYKEEYDTPIIKPKNVLVVGGGNVAMDAARCARRLGNPNVTVMYRRTEEEMPARKAEIFHSKEEGVNFKFLNNPVSFFGENGKVSGAKYLKMRLSDKTDNGRRNVSPILEQEYIFEADMVIVAIGNNPNGIIKYASDKIEYDEKGRIKIDDKTMRSTLPFVYAGGDIVTGAATVILAMGAGKKAANQIIKDISN